VAVQAIQRPLLLPEHRRSLRHPFRRNPYKGMSVEAQVASALVFVSEVREQSVRRRHMDWQDQALVYYDRVPEVAYGADFYARYLPKLVLGVGKLMWNDKTGAMEVETDPRHIDKIAYSTLDGFQDPGGGRAKFLASYGRLLFTSGDGYAVGRTVEKVDQWEFFSHKEFRVKPGTGPGQTVTAPVYQRLEAPGLPYEEMFSPPDDDLFEDLDPNECLVARLWKPHPIYSWWATSSLRSLLGVCEELLLNEQAIHARLTARAAAGGLLFIPNSIANAIPETEPRTQEERAMTPMMRMVYQTFMTAIQQPGSPSAAIPIVLTGPDDAGDKIKLVKLFDDTVNGWPEVSNREAAVHRFAVAADFPQEYLLGTSNMSHWNAWQVDDQIWQTHLQPVCDMLVADLASVIFRPRLIAQGIPEDEASSYVITYDESEIVTRPDKSGAAKDGYDRGIVSGETYRRESGLEEDDAMEDDEYARWLGVQVKDAGLALTGEPTPAPVPAGGPEQPSDDDGEQPHGPPPEPEGQPERPSEEAPPVPSGVPREPPNASFSETALVLGAAELAVARCREVAGARLASRAQRCEDCKTKITKIPKSMVPFVLGPDGLPTPTPPAETLIAGAMDVFTEKLIEWGLDVTLAGYLSTAVERHAAETLWDEGPVGLPHELHTYAEA
jgi:hypothetical protein